MSGWLCGRPVVMVVVVVVAGAVLAVTQVPHPDPSPLPQDPPQHQPPHTPPGQGRSEGQIRKGSGQGHERLEGQGRSEGQGQGRSEDLGQGRSEGQGQGRSEGQGQGRSEDLGQGRSEGQWRSEGQGQGRSEDQGRSDSQGPGQGQVRSDAQGPHRGRNRPEGQTNQGSGQGHERSEGQAQGRSEDQGQSRLEGQGQGRSESQGQGRSGQERSDQGQGRSEDQGQGRSEDQAQGPSRGQDRPEGRTNQGSDQGSKRSKGQGRSGGVVLVTLGWGEEEAVTSSMSSLLRSHGHDVTVIVYGARRSAYTSEVEVLEVPVAADDPMFPGGVGVGVTAEEVDEDGRGWAVSGRVMRSRVCACREFSRQGWVEEAVAGAGLLVTPLFLHDLCTLTLAKRLGVAAVGVVTSRVGAWWVWHQLDLLPPLATTPVPPHTMEDLSVWSRAANLASHYGYISTVRQSWQVPATTSINTTAGVSLGSLYGGLAGVLVAWDPLLDPSLPHHPGVVPVGGINLQPGLMAKDVLVPALLNRAGVLTVSVAAKEAWVGPAAHSALRHALLSSPYTVLWREESPSLPSQDQDQTAKFVYKPNIPLSDVLNHPRHRLLISTCEETEAMAVVYFGSPVLCLPVTSDQQLASTALKNLGVGLVIPASEVTVERLRTALQNLSGERRYRERGRQLGEELHDQPLTPDDRFLFTLERVMRKPRSNTYFSRQPTQLHLLQQSNADVYLLLLILLTAVVALLIYLAVALMSIVLAKKKHKKE